MTHILDEKVKSESVQNYYERLRQNNPAPFSHYYWKNRNQRLGHIKGRISMELPNDRRYNPSREDEPLEIGISTNKDISEFTDAEDLISDLQEIIKIRDKLHSKGYEGIFAQNCDKIAYYYKIELPNSETLLDVLNDFDYQ